MKLRRVEYSTGCSIDSVDPHRIKMGWFHGWFQYQDGDGASCCGIVEHEDGTIDYYAPGWIRFLDKPDDEAKT